MCVIINNNTQVIGLPLYEFFDIASMLHKLFYSDDKSMKGL